MDRYEAQGAGLRALVEGFSGRKVAVLGDFVADIFLFARPERLSREAPVAILRYEREELVPGCAGNVAANLGALGASAIALGAIGADEPGARLVAALERHGVDARLLVRVPGRATPAKTRILAGDANTRKQQVVRLDRGGEDPIPREVRCELAVRLERAMPEAAALIVSDYGCGTIEEPLVETVRAAVRRLPVIVDSRHEAARFATGAILKLNEGEAHALCVKRPRGEESALECGAEILARLSPRALVLTRGNQGMLVFEHGRPPVAIAAAGSREIVDVTGAGDTVGAVLALGVAAGLGLEHAARIANLAASVVVMKQGTATCSRAELLAVLDGSRSGEAAEVAAGAVFPLERPSARGA